ncbi:MAG TPA: hypothetical protein VN107_12460 [Microbacterium sp.]|nr:hypothetical protein [Microbacterium sp.]
MKSRVAAGVLAVMVAVGLAGCAGAAPKPSPTPTPPFASADAAYKAAEATYRGYVDALNNVDLDQPKTLDSAYRWLLSDALDHQRKEFSAMAAKRLTLSGDSVIAILRPVESGDPLWGDVQLAACLDVHGIDVTDSSGKSLVQGTRPNVQSLKIGFSRDASTSTGMKIASITAREGSPECGS